MSLPPTVAEARALCDRVLSGEATHDEVLAMLDADYFAACDVTDLDPRHVDTIVRWALREHVRTALYADVTSGRLIADARERTLFAARVRHGPVNTARRRTQDVDYHKAMDAIVKELRAANENRGES